MIKLEKLEVRGVFAIMGRSVLSALGSASSCESVLSYELHLSLINGFEIIELRVLNIKMYQPKA